MGDDKNKRRLNRRSFVSRVVGAAIASGGALATVTGAAHAQNRNQTGRTDGDSTDRANFGRTGVTDNDQGANSDTPGYGRSSGSGVTDNDTGANADGLGRGRGNPNVQGLMGGAQTSGITDGDSGANRDAANYGRGGRRTSRTGVSDSDSGGTGDQAGFGRGPARGAGTYTGVTDSDTGPNRDAVGYGRGS